MKNNVLLVLLMLFSFELFAATYNLPSNRPSGCTRPGNGQTVTCPGNLDLEWNDVVNVSGTVVWNITGDANLQNAKINLSGNSANLTINVGDDLTTGSGFQAKANIRVNDEVNLNSSNVHTGDITARVLNTSSYTSINGNINAESVDIGSGNNVTGNISATSYLEISSSGTIVNGNLQSNVDVFIGSNAVINGSVTAGRDLLTDSPITINGPVSVVNNFNLKGSGSRVTGNVSAKNLTMEFSNGQINGDVTVEQMLVVGGSKIVGTVFANQISLPNGSGQIEGNVVANESISIGYGGQVVGNITSPHIENNGSITGSTFCDTSNGQNPASCTAANNHLSWNFNESAWSGTVGEVLDSSVYNLHGRAVNGAFTADAAPAIATINGLGTCSYGEFTGTGASAGSGLVTVPKSSYMNNANNFSVAFWVKSSGTSGQIYMAYGKNNTTSSNRFVVYRNNSNRLAFSVMMSDGTLRTVTRTDSTVSNGAWHHVVAVYSYSNSELSLYLNGNRQSLDFNHANNNARTPIDISADSAAAFGIGAYPDSTYGMTGQMDEVRFFNRVLNTTEINALRTETSSCISAAPVLSWNLNTAAWTGASGEVLDTSGNSLNGSTYNSLLSSISVPALAGDPGTCAFSQFNGSNQYISVADNNKLDITDELTVAIWVRPRAYPGSDLMTILSKDTNYEFHLTPAGKIYWWWHDQDGVARTLTSDASVPLNQWTHVAITYKSGAQRIYINGSADINTGSYAKKLATNTLPMEVGRDNVANRYFNGDLDEILVYAKAQSQSKINEVMQERSSCSLIASCLLTEEFNDYAQWYRTVRSGTVPERVNGRLQLTNNDPNQSTSITFKQAFPTAGNKLTIEFDHFAYGGNGADGIGLVLSDATKTPVPGSFGGSLGYAPRNNVSPVQPGFAGGWLGIGFDEFGNYAKATEGRSGGVANNLDSAQAIGVRGAGSGTSGYSWLGWSGKLARSLSIGGSTPGRGDRFRITIDTATTANQVGFSLQRREANGSTFTEVLNSSNVNFTNQPAMPANFLLSFTGSTGTNTNFHALDNVQVCSFKAPVPVVIGEESIHHFELSYGNSLTCSPTEITIKACTNSDCSQLYANQVSLQLTATNGAVFESSGNITFTGSQTINLTKTVAGSTIIGIQAGSASVSTTNALQCKLGGVTSNCSLSFADSGFVFDVQDMIANQQQNVLIRAVRKDNSSQQCVPGFKDVTRSVKLWSDYIDPNAVARPESRSVLVNGIAIPKSYNLNDPNLSQNLLFNSNGQATIALNYTDAGQIQLNARYDGSVSIGDNNLVMTGSDQFIARPAGICIQEGNGSAAPVSCGSPYSNCAVYKKAGESFNLSVIAKASANNGDTNICANPISTPNFKLNSIALSHSLIAPLVADGANPGVLGVQSYNHVQSAGGIVTTAQTVSEVGVYTFTATPGANSYFGYTIAPATSAAVGRFIPAYFTVAVNTPVLAACNSASVDPAVVKFAYLGQPLGYQVFPRATLTAKNVQDQTTLNYGFSFFKAQSMLATTATAMQSAANYSTLSAVATPSAVSRGKLETTNFDAYDGQFDLTMSDVTASPASAEQISFARTLPYSSPILNSALGLTLNLADSFVKDSDGVCVKTADNTACLPITFSSITAPELRYGRMRLTGGSAPESNPTNPVSIPVSLSAEYWNGSAFVLNTADNCSAVNFANLSLESGLGKSGVAAQLTAGLSGANSLLVQIPANTLGTWPVFYQAPNWLKFDWLKEPQGQPLVLENPSAEVSVGRFRGNKRQIFWQERLN
jgi:MSHA biogenesis protein MshQ